MIISINCCHIKKLPSKVSSQKYFFLMQNYRGDSERYAPIQFRAQCTPTENYKVLLAVK